MIHQYKLNNFNIVLDVCSGSIHAVDELTYDMIALFEGRDRDAVLAAPGYSAEALPVTVLDDFRETVLAASAFAKEGDVVILSPACSSFDRFKNFAERGNTFRKIVEELK